MKIVAYGVNEAGIEGNLNNFEFSMEEIVEIIEGEQEKEKYIEELERDWLASQPRGEERAKMFDVTEEERIEYRRRFLYQRYDEVSKRHNDAKVAGEDTTALAKERFHRRIEYEIFTYRPKDDKTIPAHVILRAQEIPITNFIEHKKFMAVCPFHNEKTPSMYLRNNFFYCFGCGEKGNTIDFIRKTRGYTFQEAIKFLQ